jgi:CRISPR/Cas system CMR-associated protein Cmr5 small subunit
VIRKPESAADIDTMVEENEVRADLSFYERAHCDQIRQGVYKSTKKEAVKSVFHGAPCKRSKSWPSTVVEALDSHLQFQSHS